MAHKPRADKLIKEAKLEELARIISELDEDGRDILLAGISTKLTASEKRLLLEKIKARVAQADVEVRDWLVESIGTAYVSGLNDTDELLKRIGINTGIGKINLELIRGSGNLAPHLEAVNNLLSEAYLDFGSGMSGYIKGAERILNETLRRQIRSEIALGRLEGVGIQEIKRTVKNLIGDSGFTVLLDRGGRQWTLSNYSEMLARTHVIRANNEATINRAMDFNIDIVEVSTHGATDALCAPQEGKIYSISGKSKNYPPLAGNEPPYHPNCAHGLLLRPDLV